MRLGLIVGAVLAWAVGAAPSAAGADAPRWCSVPPDDAARAVGPVMRRLGPAMQRPPQPLAHLHTEGTLPHQGIYDASIAAQHDLPIMRDAALAWRAGAGDAAFDLARRYLLAWVSVYRPDFNPIDETTLDALVQTYAVIHPGLTADEAGLVRTYLRQWAQGYVDRMDTAAVGRHRPDTWRNNWNSHRVKLVTMIAVATGDAGLFGDSRRLFWAQLAQNIRPDGSVIDFALRDALHYVTYDLEPLLQAALAARSMGEDWFAVPPPSPFQQGASLAQAVAWLRPYADGSAAHEEYVHSSVAFDAVRTRAGLKGFAGPFDPKLAATVFWLAGQFDSANLALARNLAPLPPTFLALCGQ